MRAGASAGERIFLCRCACFFKDTTPVGGLIMVVFYAALAAQFASRIHLQFFLNIYFANHKSLSATIKKNNPG